MPFYEYQCDACGHEQEEFFPSISAAEPYMNIFGECLEVRGHTLCGGTLRRVLSTTLTPIFYGSGWTKNISKRHSYKTISEHHGNTEFGKHAPPELP